MQQAAASATQSDLLCEKKISQTAELKQKTHCIIENGNRRRGKK